MHQSQNSLVLHPLALSNHHSTLFVYKYNSSRYIIWEWEYICPLVMELLHLHDVNQELNIKLAPRFIYLVFVGPCIKIPCFFVYICGLAIHLSVDTQVVYTCWLLWRKLQCTHFKISSVLNFSFIMYIARGRVAGLYICAIGRGH